MDVGRRRRRRLRDGQPMRPSPAPTPGGYHQPTTLLRIDELDDPIHVYKDRDGVLVTDDLDGVTRPVSEVVSNLQADKKIYQELQQQAQSISRSRPPIPEDKDGSTRPVDDVCRRDDIEPDVSALKELLDLTSLEESSVTKASSLPQPTIHEDRSQNVFASKELLDTTTLEELSITNASSLPQPILHDDREQNVLASKELLDTTTLEDESITNASMPQPTSRAQTEPNVLASKELLDTTTLEGLSITRPSSLPRTTSCAHTGPNVLASKELLDTTALEGLSITRPSSLPRTTSPLKEELIPPPQLLQALDKARASADLFPTQSTDSAYHYSALEEPDMFSSNKFIVSDASSTRAEVLTHSPTPPISALKFAGWNHQFFIRVDHDEVFHTYPELDGPFQSLEEAEDAIFLRLDELEDPKMCTNDGLSRAEIAIRDALYWPDGTRKYSSRSNPDEDHMELLVQALLDKYNEENKLLGDQAYQVGKVVSFQEVYEGHDGWYYHLNCTRKTKGGVDGQFFAEVLKKIRGELEEFELTCLHMLEPVDNGTCYGCTNDTIGMKHPIDAGKYKGGHNRSWPRYFGRHQLLDINDIDKDNPLLFPKDMDARMKAEEKRIRYFFEEHHVAKPDARKTPASLDKSQGRSVKYVVPARRQLV